MLNRAELQEIVTRNAIGEWIMLGLMALVLGALLWVCLAERKAKKELRARLREQRADNYMLAVTPAEDVQEREGKLWYRVRPGAWLP